MAMEIIEIVDLPTMWGPQTIAKLVNITPIMILITRVNGIYKPTNITGGPHIVLTMGIFQFATLVYQAGYQVTKRQKSSLCRSSSRRDITSKPVPYILPGI